jgi:hypothetical protein
VTNRTSGHIWRTPGHEGENLLGSRLTYPIKDDKSVCLPSVGSRALFKGSRTLFNPRPDLLISCMVMGVHSGWNLHSRRRGGHGEAGPGVTVEILAVRSSIHNFVGQR